MERRRPAGWPGAVPAPLGAARARGLATASGGSFVLENREGGGAVARLELPAATMRDEELVGE